MTLREMRFRKRITQVKLSHDSGINQGTLSQIENGWIKPSKKHRAAIETALQLPEGFINWEEKK